MGLPNNAFLELREVSKRFNGGPLVLDRVTLDVRAGDFVSFIGPSGCGKSTLLRLVAELSSVTTGQIERHHRTIDAGPSELAYVFQEPTLLPWLSVRKNVEIPLRLRGVAAADREERCRRALALVRLTEKRDAYPRQLSGGQKMRVSIARALSTDPSFLLLDEPFGALDEMTREQLNEELLSIRAEKAWTAFFVTHSVAEAVFLSNRVVVMAANPGRIHEEYTIPFAYPRTIETRQSAQFHALAVEVSRALREVEIRSASVA